MDKTLQCESYIIRYKRTKYSSIQLGLRDNAIQNEKNN